MWARDPHIRIIKDSVSNVNIMFMLQGNGEPMPTLACVVSLGTGESPPHYTGTPDILWPPWLHIKDIYKDYKSIKIVGDMLLSLVIEFRYYR